MICKPRWMKKPQKDFYENANLDVSCYFAESETHFYSVDGMKRCVKMGPKFDPMKQRPQYKFYTRIDNSRRDVLRSNDQEEREYWMKKWGLM